MSFADLAHLEKSALDQNVLRYNRIKTKTPMSVEVLNTADEMMRVCGAVTVNDYGDTMTNLIRSNRCV